MFAARAIAVWFVIILAETVHGILRTIFLQPIVGDFRARQIAVFTGMLIIFLVAWLFIRWIDAKDLFQLVFVGSIWVILTFAFEVLLGRFVINASWERIFEDYDISHGGLLIFGMLFLIAAPLLAAKCRGLK